MLGEIFHDISRDVVSRRSVLVESPAHAFGEHPPRSARRGHSVGSQTPAHKPGGHPARRNHRDGALGAGTARSSELRSSRGARQ